MRLFMLIILFLVGLQQTCCAGFVPENPQGLLWYNMPEDLEDEAELPLQNTPSKQTPNMTATQRMQVFRLATQEALNQAVENPTVDNINAYRVLQNIASERASNFTWQWQKARLMNPELDYAVAHPSAQMGANTYQKQLRAAEKQSVKNVASQYGLIFFYNGKSMLDQQQSRIVADFAKEYGMPVLGVAMDQTLLDTIPNSKPNDGQAQTLGINTFPALVLYNNQTNKVQPIKYGFATQDQIEESVYAIEKNFTDLENYDIKGVYK